MGKSIIEVFNNLGPFDKLGTISSILTIITVLINALIFTGTAILRSKKEEKDDKDKDLKDFEIKERRSKEKRKELLHTIKEAKDNLITINKIEEFQNINKENRVLQRNSKETIEIYRRLPHILQYFGQLGGLSRLFLFCIFPLFYMTYYLQINESLWQIIGGGIVIIIIREILGNLGRKGYIFGKNEKSVKFSNSLTRLRLLPIILSFALMTIFFITGSIILIFVNEKLCTIMLENYKKRGKFSDSLGYVVAKWFTVIIVIYFAYLFRTLNLSYFDFFDVSSMYHLYATIICATLQIITYSLFLYADGKYHKLCTDEGKEELINNSILLNILPQDRTIDYIQKLIDVTINNRRVETLPDAKQIIKRRVRK